MIDIEDRDGVRLVTWNRPEALNAMSLDMWNGTRDALLGAADAGARAIVLTGTGRAFNVGQDLTDMSNPGHAEEGAGFRGTMNALYKNPVPLLAAVNGMAIGFGTTLLPWCDIAIAAESARFRTPFVALGLTTEAGSSASLPEIMGPQAAAAFVLTGEWMAAADAKKHGLVYEVVPDDQLLSTTLDLARRIAAGPPTALFTTRRLLRNERVERFNAAVERESIEFATLAGGPENLAAIDAFLNKR